MHIDQREALARLNDIGSATINAIDKAKDSHWSIKINDSSIGAVQAGSGQTAHVTLPYGINGLGYIGKGDTIPTRSLHLGDIDQEYVKEMMERDAKITARDAIKPIDPFKTGQVGGSHYEKMAIQPFEYSMANRLDPMQHTIVKYVTRFREKNGIEDLKKARHVIDLLIAHEQKTNPQGSK